jgi:diaminohydroxyphosphoribosylaminopyrimidine deaminase/5-amino-6-(5-phosphoribosylamino)uracil reductase
MKAALQLAEQAIGLSDPNPRVGCVIVSADGAWLLGQGHTQAAGSAHAEVMALREAAVRGHSVVGATAHVTLEPCAHHGRTPPCCDALIHAGLARVVVAVGDPNPLVNGQGSARLRAAGVVVEPDTTDEAAAAEALNIGFFHRMRTGRSWVRMKMAASLDGRTALNNGASQWITSPPARIDGHAWRKRAGAVITGIGTVLADDPRLDVREVHTQRQPLRAVVDARLDTPLTARLFESGEPPQFFTAFADPARMAAFQRQGATVHQMPGNLLTGSAGRVDLAAVLAELARQSVNEIHIEAGQRLNGALLEAGLVDELLIYQAPMLLGLGQGMAALGPYEQLNQSQRFEWIDSTPVGPDMRLRLRRISSNPEGRMSA